MKLDHERNRSVISRLITVTVMMTTTMRTAVCFVSRQKLKPQAPPSTSSIACLTRMIGIDRKVDTSRAQEDNCMHGDDPLHQVVQLFALFTLFTLPKLPTPFSCSWSFDLPFLPRRRNDLSTRINFSIFRKRVTSVQASNPPLSPSSTALINI